MISLFLLPFSHFGIIARVPRRKKLARSAADINLRLTNTVRNTFARNARGMGKFLIIANNARDLYGSLLVIGVMSHIAIQVILNIAVVTNSLPNTGVILPFISYGGTSIIFLMAEIGLVLSVSRGIRLENV